MRGYLSYRYFVYIFFKTGQLTGQNISKISWITSERNTLAITNRWMAIIRRDCCHATKNRLFKKVPRQWPCYTPSTKATHSLIFSHFSLRHCSQKLALTRPRFFHFLLLFWRSRNPFFKKQFLLPSSLNSKEGYIEMGKGRDIGHTSQSWPIVAYYSAALWLLNSCVARHPKVTWIDSMGIHQTAVTTHRPWPIVSYFWFFFFQGRGWSVRVGG